MFRRIPREISVAPPSAAPPGRFAPRAKGMVRGSFPKNTDFESCWGNDPVISFEAGGKRGAGTASPTSKAHSGCRPFSQAPNSSIFRHQSARERASSKRSKSARKFTDSCNPCAKFWVGPGILGGVMGVPETPRPDQARAKSLPGRARTAPRRFKRHLRRPKRHPPRPRRHPRRPQRRPRAMFGNAPKLFWGPPGGPGRPQDGPRDTRHGPGGSQDGPRGAPERCLEPLPRLLEAFVCFRGAWELGVGHPVGARRAARLVIYVYFCESVLLRATEEKDQQWR